jgi:hypothetical protein
MRGSGSRTVAATTKRTALLSFIAAHPPLQTHTSSDCLLTTCAPSSNCPAALPANSANSARGRPTHGHTKFSHIGGQRTVTRENLRQDFTRWLCGRGTGRSRSRTRSRHNHHPHKSPTHIHHYIHLCLPPPASTMGSLDGACPWCMLGLQPGADAASARRAFRRLAVAVHPDKLGMGASKRAVCQSVRPHSLLRMHARQHNVRGPRVRRFWTSGPACLPAAGGDTAAFHRLQLALTQVTHATSSAPSALMAHATSFAARGGRAGQPACVACSARRSPSAPLSAPAARPPCAITTAQVAATAQEPASSAGELPSLWEGACGEGRASSGEAAAAAAEAQLVQRARTAAMQWLLRAREALSEGEPAGRLAAMAAARSAPRTTRLCRPRRRGRRATPAGTVGRARQAQAGARTVRVACARVPRACRRRAGR